MSSFIKSAIVSIQYYAINRFTENYQFLNNGFKKHALFVYMLNMVLRGRRFDENLRKHGWKRKKVWQIGKRKFLYDTGFEDVNVVNNNA